MAGSYLLQDPQKAAECLNNMTSVTLARQEQASEVKKLLNNIGLFAHYIGTM